MSWYFTGLFKTLTCWSPWTKSQGITEVSRAFQTVYSYPWAPFHTYRMFEAKLNILECWSLRLILSHLSRIDSLSSMNVCAHFHENPSSSCQEMSLKNKTVSLVVVVQVTRVKGIHPLGNMIVCTWKCFHPITLSVALTALIWCA